MTTNKSTKLKLIEHQRNKERYPDKKRKKEKKKELVEP
jgi:hypothetical protein